MSQLAIVTSASNHYAANRQKDEDRGDGAVDDGGFIPIVSKHLLAVAYSAYRWLSWLLLICLSLQEGHDKMKTIIGADAAEPWMDLTACPKLSKLQVLESDWQLGMLWVVVVVVAFMIIRGAATAATAATAAAERSSSRAAATAMEVVI